MPVTTPAAGFFEVPSTSLSPVLHALHPTDSSGSGAVVLFQRHLRAPPEKRPQFREPRYPLFWHSGHYSTSGRPVHYWTRRHSDHR